MYFFFFSDCARRINNISVTIPTSVGTVVATGPSLSTGLSTATSPTVTVPPTSTSVVLSTSTNTFNTSSSNAAPTLPQVLRWEKEWVPLACSHSDSFHCSKRLNGLKFFPPCSSSIDIWCLYSTLILPFIFFF